MYDYSEFLLYIGITIVWALGILAIAKLKGE